MKNIKSLYSPFAGSLLHSVCAIAAALVITAGIIFLAHTVATLPPEDSSYSSSFADDAALKAEMEKVASEENSSSEVA